MATLFVAPVANFTQTTLNGALTSGAGTIVLNSVTSLQSPGYVVIDRTNSAGTSTPSLREVVFYTGISGSTLTGVTRGADGSTGLSHSDGAVVETMPTVGMWNSLTTVVATAIDSNGLLQAISSPVSVAIGRFIQFDAPSIASIARIQTREFISTSGATINEGQFVTRANFSGASVTGFGIYPAWRSSGAYSGPTTVVGGYLISPKAGQIQWVSVLTRTVASGTSVGFDIKKNGTSIFANATMRPAIAAAGTYVSTASIATKNIDQGNLLQADVDSAVSGAGLITDVTIQFGTA